MTVPLTVSAPAKINLFLHITGRRADGYHLLQSLFGFTDFGDRLDLQPADDLTLIVDGPFSGDLADTSPEQNLVFRAAQTLRERYGVSQGACMTLHKHVPVAAGVGGGSSDAAAALRGLCRLWSLMPDPRDMDAMALDLGADVPACLTPTPQWVEGIGEIRQPFSGLSECALVLANPQKPLSTRDVFRYRAVQQKGFSAAINPDEDLGDDALAWISQHTCNDLEIPAKDLLADIEPLLLTLNSAQGCRWARMSGSGPTCFGIFQTTEMASAACRNLKAAFPNAWFVDTKLKSGL